MPLLGVSVALERIFIIAFDAIEGLVAFPQRRQVRTYFRFGQHSLNAAPRHTGTDLVADRNAYSGTLAEPGFSCRASLRSQRRSFDRNVASLRIRSETSSSALYLSFGFTCKIKDAIAGVVHRVRVADANGVSAVATRDSCSEIVAIKGCSVSCFLKKTAEASMVIQADAHDGHHSLSPHRHFVWRTSGDQQQCHSAGYQCIASQSRKQGHDEFESSIFEIAI
jgi:hypothetical protein